MLELSSYRFEHLGTAGDFAVRRGFDEAGVGRVLVLHGLEGDDVAAVVARFEQCIAISRALAGDDARFVRSLAVQQHEGRLVLVVEDPGGELLSSLIRGPMDLRTALRIGIDLAGALDAFHARGFLHRDVKPGNVLVNGRARLSGFGLSLQMPRHRQAPDAPRRLVGTLAYMAPEQSGWTNRSIDSRSDLYALGVTLYEMLTGELPFVATDLAEWVHCHVARTPMPPHGRLATIPPSVSAIVTKLLAKSPEDRYQTAQGIVVDLERCLAELDARGAISEFQVGTDDVTRRLVIPERLYGRTSEVAVLLSAFERMVERKRPELVLVGGHSGIGKSSIVAELYKELVPARGRFVSGKCDQYKRDIPYATLGQAIAKLVSSLLGESEVELSFWKTRLLDALGAGGRFLVDLVPELALIIGEPPALPALPPQEAQILFQTVLRRFLAAFSRSEHPLVVFLDDLQWLDAATLDLAAHILGHDESGSLLLIGAYRDNEIGPDHPLRSRLDALRAREEGVRELVLVPLCIDDVTALVADTVRDRDVDALAAIIHAKTGGNPFFAVQFLSTLSDAGLLVFHERERRWRWDENAILARGFTDDVVELMLEKIARLPEATREVMRSLACFGAFATSALLADLEGSTAAAVDAALLDALRTGLVWRPSPDAYGFTHDRVQEAAYGLTPVAMRPAVHLRLGRLLLERTDPREDMLFEIVSQLNRGASLMTERRERLDLASMNLTAGLRARAASAHDAALGYFEHARAYLGDEGWTDARGPTFEASFHEAECLFFNGRPDVAESALAALASRAANLVEAARIVCIRVDIAVSLGRYEHALDVGIPYLARAGLEWPVDPTEADIGRELARVEAQAGTEPVARFVDLPAMADPGRIATMDVLAGLIPPAMFRGAFVYALLVGRAVNLSLEHGLSDAAPMVFAVFGMMKIQLTNDQSLGHDWSDLGLAILEKRGFRRFRAKVYITAGHMVTWVTDFRRDARLGELALQAGTETGDVVFANYGHFLMTRDELARGTALAHTERVVMNGLAHAEKVADGMVSCFAADLNVVRALRGGPYVHGSFPDEAALEAALDADPSFAMIVGLNQTRKLQRLVYLDRGEEALAAAVKAQRAVVNGNFYFQYGELQFYGAIAHAMMHDRTGDPALVDGVKEKLVPLRAWAQMFPPTFAHRRLLVEAELARIEGRKWEALELYEEAIRTARANGWRQHEALGHERAARFFRASGFEEPARGHFRAAHQSYVHWGATAKARLLESELGESEVRAAERKTVEASVEQLDLATVLKVSNAIAGEMVHDKLVRQLLVIAVEHAGAERALLFLGDESPRAEAIAQPNGFAIRALDGTSEDFPRTMIRWVMRTKEALIVADRQGFEPFPNDAYLLAVQPRSVVALPLVKQGTLTGVLYLENRLSAGIFREARISALKLVAGQAAIALDNARLYDELRVALASVNRSEEQLRVTLDAVPEMTWYNTADGGNEFQSEVWREYTGMTSEDSRGTGWLAALHPEDVPGLMTTWGGLLAAGVQGQAEARVRRSDGVYRWMAFRAKPRRDASGAVVKWYGNTVDIDDLKRSRAALVQLQGELAHVARLDSLGTLTASIAHEVNQPIAAVSMNVNAALRWLDRDQPNVVKAREAIGRIQRDSTRMRDIIARLRSLFLKQGAPERTALALNEVIEEVIELTRSEATKQGVTLQLRPGAELPAISGDRVQLQQVVLNLVNNAFQAMLSSPRRELDVATSFDDDRVVIEVSDTGTGLPAEIAERVFEPFQSTKPNGMGMGLAITKRIVEDHGGEIRASTNREGGATFRVALPAL